MNHYHQQIVQQLADERAARQTVEAERDGAYRERAHLTAWLAVIHPAVITDAPDIDEPGWQLLYLTVGERQMSWHISPRDGDLYAHVEHVDPTDPRAQWDGHTTDQKYETIRQLTFSALRGDDRATVREGIRAARALVGIHQQRAEQAEARITAVRALHQPVDDWSWKSFGCQHDGAHTRLCGTCKTCSPCATIRALDGASAPTPAAITVTTDQQPKLCDTQVWEDKHGWHASCWTCGEHESDIGSEHDADAWADRHTEARP
ncbi:hypothetical protein ACFC26_09595 [Kitasatospora purpeofusca]|uniref:hypothetical protein n=1 Tax=Kitasatospora purpeofusca TaxID=67352 RepID=UPI0035E301AA